MMRKLATIQTITSIDPIEGADRIQKAKVLGWAIVVGKDDFQVGEKAVYIEIDGFLPASEDAYQAFQARGQKTVAHDGQDVTGHVLRTVKLRGVISQGLLMPISKLAHLLPEGDLPVGTDVTDALGIFKYEAPIPMGGSIIGPFDSRFAPKTDAVRIQAIGDKWDLIKTVAWEPTVKVDGTSQTLVNDDGTFRIFGRNWELDPESAGMKVAQVQGLLEGIDPGMALQFELIGEGIQKNRLKISGKRAIVFAVWSQGVKLPRSEWPATALASATPILSDDWKLTGELDAMLDKVSNLRGSVTRDVLDEGIVWHPVDPTAVPQELMDVLDRNCNVKIVSAKWLIRGGE